MDCHVRLKQDICKFMLLVFLYLISYISALDSAKSGESEEISFTLKCEFVSL